MNLFKKSKGKKALYNQQGVFTVYKNLELKMNNMNKDHKQKMISVFYLQNKLMNYGTSTGILPGILWES